ncbi:MAG: transglutaminase-like cysteine peptidase [Methylocystis sp.]|nr:transglutaminase-like cysteine peptidase [Methylocystis sp.]
MVGVIGKTATALALTSVALIALNASSLAKVASKAAPKVSFASYAQTGEETSVPFGWLDFCGRHAAECENGDGSARDVALTPQAFRRIAEINAAVNQAIEPVADRDHDGVVDRWDYPGDGKGDCEDYALLKRRLLIEAGFPRAALLMTVVKESNGDGHALLTVKTNRGEFVLDNLSDRVTPWTEAPYRFVKRQSQENPNVWVAIGAPTPAPAYVSK